MYEIKERLAKEVFGHLKKNYLVFIWAIFCIHCPFFMGFCKSSLDYATIVNNWIYYVPVFVGAIFIIVKI